ncbi:MAG: periplasmic heavy metal sensor [Candidatus Cloacimonetes bacterium]|nr:periplasmic heavy metal sensor [Candidatus Cloacimonadota bacterium]
MKTKTITFLLILSLAFNMAIFAGLIYFNFYGRINHLPPPGVHPDPGMQNRCAYPHVREFMEKTREMVHPLRMEFEDSRQSFIKSLMNPEATEKEIKYLFKESLHKQMRMEEEIGKHMIEFRKQMSPEAARKYFKIFSRQKHNQMKRRRR